MKKIIISESLKEFVERDVNVLTKSDNRIFYIKSGQEALDLHRKEKADLIIAELDSPDLNCEQLCTVIRGTDVLRNVAILLICSDKLSDSEICQRCGANDYIKKPLVPVEFLRKVLRLLNISERTNYKVIVKVSCMRSDDLTQFFCTSRNLSTSGILLETEKVLNKGEKITCSFFLPKTVRIVTKGEVARIENRGNGIKEYGVRFIDTPPEVESRIETFVENWMNGKKRYR